MTHRIEWKSRAYRLWLYEPGATWDAGDYPSKQHAALALQYARYYYSENLTLKGYDWYSVRAMVVGRYEKRKSRRRN
jgi:hypothetical protein